MGIDLSALPADPDACFTSPAELLAAHMEISEDEAKRLLAKVPIPLLIRKELDRQSVRILRSRRRARDQERAAAAAARATARREGRTG